MLKKSLLFLSALVLSLSLASKTIAMMEGDDSSPPPSISSPLAPSQGAQGETALPLEDIPFSVMERLMHYLTPADIVSLSRTSKSVQNNLQSGALLHPVNVVRGQMKILVWLMKNKNFTFYDKIQTASELPEEEKREWLRPIAQDVNVNIFYRIRAAEALPEGHPVRTATLRSIAQDENVPSNSRFTAAEALPEGDPVREEVLQELE